MVTINLPPKTGDTVLHKPSGETWVVAGVQNGDLYPCGWPLGIAKLADCEVTERCSEEEHLKLLKQLAAMERDWRDGYDPRKSLALAQLVEMGVPGYVLPCPFCGNVKGAGRHDVGQPQATVIEWCCAAVELRATRDMLGKARGLIESDVGRDIRYGILEKFDKMLGEAGVSCHTGQ